MRWPPLRLVAAWVALLLLLGATFTLAFVPLGAINLVVALTIGTMKAALVVFIFMELTRGPPLRRLFAGAGLFWLLFLFGLSLTDYATRRGWPFAG